MAALIILLLVGGLAALAIFSAGGAAKSRTRAPPPAAPPEASPTSPPVQISTSTGKRGPDWMLSNVGPELAGYFKLRPMDPVWKCVTWEKAPAYQLWFQRMLLRAGLLGLFSSSTITDEIATKMAEVATEAGETHDLNAQLLLVIAHQYVDADAMMRGIHTTDLVATIMSRPDFAPSPEGYVTYLKERFFS